MGCRSEAAAFNRIQELAKQKDPEALYILGRVYELGGNHFGLTNVKENVHLAQKYYLESARLGYAEAQNEMGWWYAHFYAFKDKNSHFWFCKAALQHNDNAISNLQAKIAYSHSFEGKLEMTWQQFCKPIIAKGEPK